VSCPIFLVSAKITSILLKDSLVNHRSLWLNRGYNFPSLEFAIRPVVGLSAKGTR
jgi:hypothetical protein